MREEFEWAIFFDDEFSTVSMFGFACVLRHVISIFDNEEGRADVEKLWSWSV